MRATPPAPQLSFEDLPRHGGRRPGAGRVPGPRPRVPHRKRPLHRRWCPLHVTLRVTPRFPSLRAQLLFRIVEGAIRATRPAGFRVVHFSVQRDHVHTLVEAADNATLTRGMRSLTVRIAMRLNRVLGRRRGRVWGDRYHRHDLEKPRVVRNALVYVLANFKKHEGINHGRPLVDVCSSAPWFDGWLTDLPRPWRPSPTQPPTTLLLSELWRRHGLIHPGERPAMRRQLVGVA